MQTIETRLPEVTEILFRSGPREPVIVEDVKQVRELHHQHPERLDKMEFFAPNGHESPDCLRAKLASFSSKKAQTDILELESDLNLDEVPEVFDLPPLSQRRVTARIRTIEPATFYFVDDDVPLLDDEE